MLDLYDEDKEIKEYIDLYLKKLNEFLEKEKQEAKKERSSDKKKTNPTSDHIPKSSGKKSQHRKVQKSRSKPNTSNAKAVDDLNPAVRFVIRYKNLHGKIKERKHIASFLASLQRAIIKHQVGKDNPYSKEIEHIQQQLIRTLKLMGGEVKINIKDESLEKYVRIAESEKIRLSVAYIKRFISLADKTQVKDKAQRLLTQIDKALNTKRITENDKYKNEIDEIRQYLYDYVNSHSKKMQVDEFTLNGLQEITGEVKKKTTIRT